MLRAGIWPTARSLVVAIDVGGPAHSRLHMRVERSLEGRQQLASLLAREPYLEVVVPEMLHQVDAVADHLRLHHVHVWLAPRRLVDTVVDLLGVRPSAHVTLAMAIARLPALALLRPGLRALPQPDPNQLCLAFPPST